MDITNKTRKPLSIPLPGGKKLFLGPGKTGQIAPKAAERPALKKLIDAGEVEVTDTKRGHSEAGGDGSGKAGPSSGAGRSATGAMRQSGDR